MTFAQRRNRLKTHFSEHIPFVKRRISLYSLKTASAFYLGFVMERVKKKLWFSKVSTDYVTTCRWQHVASDLKADSHIACRSPAMPCSYGFRIIFPIRFTQCGRVWFTLGMPCPCHAPTKPFFSRPRHSTAVSRRPCCAVTKCDILIW